MPRSLPRPLGRVSQKPLSFWEKACPKRSKEAWGEGVKGEIGAFYATSMSFLIPGTNPVVFDAIGPLR